MTNFPHYPPRPQSPAVPAGHVPSNRRRESELLENCLAIASTKRTLHPDIGRVLEFRNESTKDLVIYKRLGVTKTHLIAQMEITEKNLFAYYFGICTFAVVCYFCLLAGIVIGPHALVVVSPLLFLGLIVSKQVVLGRQKEFRQPLAELSPEIIHMIENFDEFSTKSEGTGSSNIQDLTETDHRNKLRDTRRTLVKGLSPGSAEISAIKVADEIERGLALFSRVSQVNEVNRYFSELSHQRFPDRIKQFTSLGSQPSLAQTREFCEDMDQLRAKLTDVIKTFRDPELARLFVYSKRLGRDMRSLNSGSERS